MELYGCIVDVTTTSSITFHIMVDCFGVLYRDSDDFDDLRQFYPLTGAIFREYEHDEERRLPTPVIKNIARRV